MRETTVTLEIGETVGLRNDFNALSLIEAVLPVNMLDPESLKDLATPDATQLRAVVYGLAGAYRIVRDEPRLSLAEVGGLLTEESAQRFTEAIEALTQESSA